MPPAHPWHLTFLLLLVQQQTHIISACSGAIDLVFCVDGSGSVTGNERSGNWKTQTDFVKLFVDTYSGNSGDTTCDLPAGHAPGAGDECGTFKGELGLKVGILIYGDDQGTAISLSTDYQAIKTASTNRIETGATATGACLTAAQTMLEDTSQGARSGAAKIIVLISDGVATDGTTTPSTAAKAAGTKIIGIGVNTGGTHGGECLFSDGSKTWPDGSDADCSSGDRDILKCVSEPNKEYFTRVADFSGLAAKVNDFTQLACPMDCTGSFSDWSLCDVTTGTQSRQFNIVNPARDGGEACPGEQTQPCPVDCSSTLGEWSPISCIETLTQYQEVIVSIPPKNNGKSFVYFFFSNMFQLIESF